MKRNVKMSNFAGSFNAGKLSSYITAQSYTLQILEILLGGTHSSV